MSTQTQIRRAEQLGMPWGTATHRLRKLILFDYVQRSGEDFCFRCATKIETVDDLSIEHKIPWAGNPELFWDLANIAFSHLRCNTIAGNENRVLDPARAIGLKHGSAGYRRGCRCDVCRTEEMARVMEWKRRNRSEQSVPRDVV